MDDIKIITTMFGKISIFILAVLLGFGQNACYEVSSQPDTIGSAALVSMEKIGTSLLVVGSEMDNGFGLLHRFDNSLQLLRSHKISGQNEIFLYRSTISNDGNLVITGTIYDSLDNVIITKISPTTNNLIWSKLIKINNTDLYPMEIATLKDGSYIVIGSGIFNINNYGAVILRISSQGQLLWAKKVFLEGNIDTEIDGIAPANDGNFYITGYATSPITGIDYGFVAKMSPTGNFIWKKRISFYSSDIYGFSVAEAPDRSIVVAGTVDSVSNDSDFDIFIMKMNSAGQKLWSKVFTATKDSLGGSDEEYSFVKILGSNEILILSTSDFGLGYSAPFGVMLKIDMQGNLQWNKIVKSAEFLLDGIADNNGVIAVGFSQNETQYLLKYNPNSSICSGCGVETQGYFSNINISIQDITYYSLSNLSPSLLNFPLTITPVNYKNNNGCNIFSGINKKTLSLKVYPTITSGQITIEEVPAGNIFIYNSLGQQVLKQQNTYKNNVYLDLSDKPNGIYLLRFISNDNRVFTTKIIKR